MLLPTTFQVTSDNGPRPAGEPDECFYCRQPLGSSHRDDCVCREKTVVVEVKLTMVISVPAHWTKEQIEFRYGESTWCASNVLETLAKMQDEHIMNDRDGTICLCDRTKVSYVREATGDDHERYGVVSIG